MDEYAFYIANQLLNNSLNTNILEINFANISLLAHEDTTIAITGACCDFYINDKTKSTWRTFNIFKGDILKIGTFKKGARVYLGIKDGFNIKKEIYGLSGNKLKKGDKLLFNASKQNSYNQKLKEKFIPKYEDTIELRVTLSYQEKYFNKEEKNKFFSSEYKVSSEISRMGYKLQGAKIKCDIDGIISEGIAYGSIQIPKNGQVIILLKDRQTIGGYPKLGVVLDVDCFKLSQAKVNTKIKFKEISMEEAGEISRLFYSNIINYTK